MAFNNEDILILAKASFNAQQIAALNIVGQQPAPAPQPIPEVQPEPQPQLVPETQTTQQPTSTIDDVLKSVEGLTKTFQNGFMLGAQQPKPVTAEDILANIINPPQE